MESLDVDALLTSQDGVVAWRQLRDGGLTEDVSRRVVRGMREVHDGVRVSGHAPLTDRQRWLAATLTTPDSVLSHASAGGLHGVLEWRASFDVVTRPGDGGPRRFGSLLVCYSSVLEPDVVRIDGIPVTSGPRTVLDLVAAPHGRTSSARIVREALRVGAVDGPSLRMILGRHKGARGTAVLRRLTDKYEKLPARRSRSDAELLAVAILDAAGVPLPRVNAKHAGHAADLSWPDWGLIIELDSLGFHKVPAHDAEVQAKWEAAGWVVLRMSTDDVYDRPEVLLALATPPLQR